MNESDDIYLYFRMQSSFDAFSNSLVMIFHPKLCKFGSRLRILEQRKKLYNFWEFKEF